MKPMHLLTQWRIINNFLTIPAWADLIQPASIQSSTQPTQRVLRFKLANCYGKFAALVLGNQC